MSPKVTDEVESPDCTVSPPHQSAARTAVSLRLGHATALTCHRHVIHSRGDTALPSRGSQGHGAPGSSRPTVQPHGMPWRCGSITPKAFPLRGRCRRRRRMRWKPGMCREPTSSVRCADSCLAAARSRHGSDMPPACHSLPWRHCVTLKGKPRPRRAGP